MQFLLQISPSSSPNHTYENHHEGIEATTNVADICSSENIIHHHHFDETHGGGGNEVFIFFSWPTPNTSVLDFFLNQVGKIKFDELDF